METALIIYPNNEADASLYRQLAKRPKNRIEEETVIEVNKAKKSKHVLLNDISESIKEMKLHRQRIVTSKISQRTLG